MSTKKLYFNNAPNGDLAVNVTCERARRDPLGNVVAANQPRYGAPSAYAEPVAWTKHIASVSAIRPLATGFDLDSQSSLTWLWNGGNNQLTIYRDDVLVTTRTIAGTAGLDLIAGTDLEESGKRFLPYAGTIVDGAVIVACERMDAVNGVEGVSLVRLQPTSNGANDWFASGNVTKVDFAPLGGDGTYYGARRGREWAMPDKGWSVPGVDHRLVRVVTWTDYMIKGGGVESYGGQVFAQALWRDAIGDPWTYGTPVLLWDGVIEDGAQASRHYHCAGFVWHDDKHASVVWHQGDSPANSNVRRVILTHEDGDIVRHLDQATIAIDDDLSGTTDLGDASRGGAQPIGMVQGRVPGEIFTSSDESSDPAIGYYTLPNWDETGKKIQIHRLFGSPYGGTESAHNCFCICAADIGGPWAGSFRPASAAPGQTNNASWRVWYSRDGRNAAVFASHPTTGSAEWMRFDSPRRLILENRLGDGVYRCDVPKIVTRRPLLVGRGGTNIIRKHDATSYEHTGNSTDITVTWLTWDGDEIVDGETRYPSPPGIVPGSPVCKVTCGGVGATIGSFRCVEENTSLVGQNVPAWFSAWVRPTTDSIFARLRPSHQNTSFSDGQIYVGMSGHDWARWIVSGTRTAAAWRPSTFWHTSTASAQAMEFLICFEWVGLSWPASYASEIPAKGGADVVLPDERVTVSGFECGDAWTISLAARIPAWEWDSGGALMTPAQITSVPLATLYSNDDEHIELHADLANSRVVATVYNSGVSAGTLTVNVSFFKRLDPMTISVTSDGETMALYATIGGYRIGAASVLTDSDSGSLALAAQPTQIRFGEADWSSVAMLEVFACYVDEDNALDAQAVAALHAQTALVGPTKYVMVRKTS